VIEALGGTYAVNLRWDPGSGNGHSGTAANPITFEGYPGGPQAVFHSAAVAGSEMLKVTGGASFIRFKGFKVEADANLWSGTGHQPFYVSGAGGAHDIDLLALDFAGNNHDITAFLAGPGATHINLVGNRVHDWGTGATQRQGLYVQADSGMLANNVVDHLPYGFGIQVRADTSTVKTCALIVTDNTVVDIGGQRGIYVENNCAGVRIRNNVSAFAGQEELYGLYEAGSDPPGSSNRAFSNLVWDSSGPYTGDSSGHQILDFRDGLGDYSGPGQNRVGDPLFVDRANRDYHLRSGSAAIGYADPHYSFPTDFDGHARHASTPDAGAFEH